MRIAQVAPLYEVVPPAGYGGTERVIAALCNGLVARGHDVTLFAAGSSTTRARLVVTAQAPLRARMSRQEMIEVAPHLHLRMLADVYERADDFDVIHSHVDIWTLPFAHRAATPTVITMHGRLDLDHLRQTLPLYPHIPLVSISNHQRTPLAGLDLHWAATVYNGLDLEQYHEAIRPNNDGHLAFVGRINPDKGPAMAVEIARRAGRPLRVAAKIDPLDVDYYRDEIEPLFRANDVWFLGELEERHKPAFYASAAATVFPSDWPEPFGLVMLESMAAGTPVVALRRGSVPEIIIDGVTGFICDDVHQMVDAIDHLDDIDPDKCRHHAASFSAANMCSGYERVYESICFDTADELIRESAELEAKDMIAL